MTLYVVGPNDYRWQCFVITTTHNRAKNEVAKHFGLDYMDMRCRIIKKDVGNEELIIDDDTAAGYEIVLENGEKYLSGEIE